MKRENTMTKHLELKDMKDKPNSSSMTSSISFTILRSALVIAMFIIIISSVSAVRLELNQFGIVTLSTGNIGIGTKAPGYLLDVNGSSYPTIRAISTGSNGGQLKLASSTSNWTAYVQANDLRFYNGSADTVTFQAGGNVGIGIANPTTKLQVAGGISVTAGNDICISGGNCLSTAGASTPSGWTDDGVNVRLTTVTDNVGIGTATPSQKLDVQGNVNISGTLTVGGVQFAVIPSGMIAMFDAACPAGWTRVAALDNKFPRGAAAYGGTGGADSHTHTAGTYAGPSHTHTYSGTTSASSSPGWNFFGNSDWLQYDWSGHTHDYSGTTAASGTGAVTGTSASASNVPAYVNVIFCRKN